VRVLIDHSLPFQLAHGGVQKQIEETRRALCALGVDAQFLAWWKEDQVPDLIHFFGVPSWGYLTNAARKRIPVIATNFFSETCNRPPWRLGFQATIVRLFLALPGGGTVKNQLHWIAYRNLACNCVGLLAERRILELIYGVSPARIREIPLGVSDEILHAPRVSRQGGPLVCVGTIAAQKNSVPLAKLAKEASVPIRFVGRPYAEDAYWREFRNLVDGEFVIHEPFVADPKAMRDILDRSRGALVVSEFENWSLAAHEATARGLPVLLRPQPWAVERFGDEAHYFDSWGSKDASKTLRKFYERAPHLPAPRVRIFSWEEVGKQLVSVYQEFLSK
jgi:glycosyltransferase involved in cell wall biosynthesis